jgi:hypothetical protein
MLMRKQLIDRLRSIEERVNDLERAKTANGLSRTEANQKLSEILSRPEYATKANQGAFIFRLLDRFFRWLAKFLPKRSPLAGKPWKSVHGGRSNPGSRSGSGCDWLCLSQTHKAFRRTFFESEDQEN